MTQFIDLKKDTLSDNDVTKAQTQVVAQMKQLNQQGTIDLVSKLGVKEAITMNLMVVDVGLCILLVLYQGFGAILAFILTPIVCFGVGWYLWANY